MTPYNAFILFVVVTVAGLVQGRVTSGVSVTSPSENDVDPQCPHAVAADPELDIPAKLLNMQHECYKPTPIFMFRLNMANSLDKYRQIFRNACAQEPSVRACISDVAASTAACLNKMEAKVFDTVRDFIESSMSAVCGNGSDAIARVYGEELKPLNASGQLAVVKCMTSMALKTAYDSETDLPAYTMRRYRGMKEGHDCMKEAAHGVGGRTTAFEAFVDPLVGAMKCISPATEEVVLCKSLVTEGALPGSGTR